MNTNLETEAKRRGELFLGVFALCGFFLMLGEYGLWGPEGVWAEGVRMVTCGSLTAAGTELISYQLARLPVELLGLTEVAVRLPGAVAAIAGLWGTLKLSKRFYGRRIALCSGWLLLGCYGFLLWGRMATGDIIGLAVAIWITELAFSLQKDSGCLRWLLWHLVWLSGGVLCGVAVWIIPAALTLPHWLSQKKWLILFSWKNFLSFITASFLICGFFCLIALSAVNESGIKECFSIWFAQIRWQNQLRLEEWSTAFYDKEAWGAILYNLPRLALPWTLLMTITIASVIKNRHRLPEGMRQLLFGYILSIVILILLPDSRWQYGLPLLPVTALFGAAGLLTECGEEKWNMWLEKIYRIGAMVAGSILVATIVALPLWQPLLGVNPPKLATVLMPLIGILALLVLLFGNNSGVFMEQWTGLPGSLASTVLSVVILVTGIISLIRPSLNEYRTGKPFWLELRKSLNEQAANTVLFFKVTPSGDDLFYLNLNYQPTIANDNSGFRNFIVANRGRRVAIVSRNQGDNLEELRRAVKANNIKINFEQPDLREQPRLRFNPDEEKPVDRGFRVWLTNL